MTLNVLVKVGIVMDCSRTISVEKAIEKSIPVQAGITVDFKVGFDMSLTGRATGEIFVNFPATIYVNRGSGYSGRSTPTGSVSMGTPYLTYGVSGTITASFGADMQVGVSALMVASAGVALAADASCILQAKANNAGSCLGNACSASIGIEAEAAAEFPMPSIPAGFCANSVPLNEILGLPALPSASHKKTLYSRSVGMSVGNCGREEWEALDKMQFTAAHFANATDVTVSGTRPRRRRLDSTLAAYPMRPIHAESGAPLSLRSLA